MDHSITLEWPRSIACFQRVAVGMLLLLWWSWSIHLTRRHFQVNLEQRCWYYFGFHLSAFVCLCSSKKRNLLEATFLSLEYARHAKDNTEQTIWTHHMIIRILLLLRPFNGLFSRTTWVSQYQKSNTSLDVNEARGNGVLGYSGISWIICKQSAPRSRQITTSTPHHSIFYRPDALPDAQPTVSKHWRQNDIRKKLSENITWL